MSIEHLKDPLQDPFARPSSPDDWWYVQCTHSTDLQDSISPLRECRCDCVSYQILEQLWENLSLEGSLLCKLVCRQRQLFLPFFCEPMSFEICDKDRYGAISLLPDDHVWPSRTKCDQIWPSMTKYNQVWPSTTNYNHVWTIMTYHNAAGRYGAISLLPDHQVLTQRFHLARQQHVALLNEQGESEKWKWMRRLRSRLWKWKWQVRKGLRKVRWSHLCLLVVLGDALDDRPPIRHTVHPPSYYILD